MDNSFKNAVVSRLYQDGFPIYIDDSYVMYQDRTSLNEILIKRTVINGTVLTIKFYYERVATSAEIDTLWGARVGKTYDNMLNL